MKQTFEIAVFFDPSGANTQVGYYKTYRANGVPPADIRLSGIVDANSMHGIQVTVDGVAEPVVLLMAAADGSLRIPFGTWFPVNDASRTACTGM